MDAGGAEDQPLGQRADVPVEALLSIEDEACPLVERWIGHVSVVAAGREVEGEGAPSAADVEGREHPRPHVRGQDRPGVLPGARPVVVAGEALQGAAFLQKGTEPARLLRQIELQHVAVDRREGPVTAVPHVEEPGLHARLNPGRQDQGFFPGGSSAMSRWNRCRKRCTTGARMTAMMVRKATPLNSA